MKNKGFTLVELMIILAIIAVIMLIGSVSYAHIIRRQKVNTDKTTGADIGRAVNVAEIDGKGDNIPEFPEVIPYHKIEGIDSYITTDFIPTSAPEGYYFVTRLMTPSGSKKTVVGVILGDEEGIFEDEVVINRIYNGYRSGLVFTDGVDVNDFVDALKRKEEETGENTISKPGIIVNGESVDGVEEMAELTVGIYNNNEKVTDTIMWIETDTPVGASVGVSGSENNWIVSGIDEQTNDSFRFNMPSDSAQIRMEIDEWESRK